jgi:cytochrome c-type biogenesis protein CcmH
VKQALLLLICFLFFTVQYRALADNNTAIENTAKTLGRELRCPVCENDTVEDSQTALAGDLRRIIREQLAAGKSVDEVKAWLVNRYGEHILLEPAFSKENLLLWCAPLLFLLLGVGLMAKLIRKKT